MTNTPIDLLEHEHLTISRLIHGLGRVRLALLDGEEVPPELLYQSVEFLREYADKRHHAKEEDALFPAMLRAGIPDCGDRIEATKAEHVEGRAAVTALEQATEAYAARGPAENAALAKVIGDVRKFYANHIYQEDYVLYPLAESGLGAQQMAEVMDAFRRIEANFSGPDHERIAQFAENFDWRVKVH